MQNEIVGRLPTIPEYYFIYINKNIDLTIDNKQCCPFHKEDTPSFSYSNDKHTWRCFGACKVGGDVIALHQKNRGFKTRDEALNSLRILHHVVSKPKLELAYSNTEINVIRVEDESTLQKAFVLANNPDRWLELDYVMSKYPVTIADVSSLIDKWINPCN